MAATHTLLDSALFKVIDSCCGQRRSGYGAPHGGHASHITLVRRGCFGARVGSRFLLADVATAIVYDDGAEYRIGHPAENGDDCTLITPAAAVMDELFGAPRGAYGKTELRLRVADQLCHAATYRQLQSVAEDVLAREERVLGLLHSLRCAEGQWRDAHRPASRAARRNRIVRLVKQHLAANLHRNLSLSALAAAAACSPYHLMRLFRIETGRTLREYRLALRVMSALHQLTARADLAALAAQLGFSSHSHMSDSIRRLTGRSPDALRRGLAQPAEHVSGSAASR